MKKLFVTFLFAGILSFIPSTLQSLIPSSLHPFNPFNPSSLHPLIPSSLSAQIPSNGMVAWYPFNGNANDESGNGNHGTVNGATLTSDRFGNLNSSYTFESGDFIDCGQLPDLGLNPLSFSISVWIKVGNISSSEAYVVGSKRHLENGATDWVTAGIYNSKYWMRFDDSGYMDAIDLYSISLADSMNWRHVVFVRNDSEMKLYVDGIIEGTAFDSHVLEGSAFNYYLGGHLAWNKFFLGEMDDVGIYNKALSPSEITQLYQDQTGQVQQPLTCNITTPTTTLCAGQSATLTMNTTGGTGASSQLPANLQQGLVAYYPFNGNANDESGNGNNGTVNGATLTADRNGNSNSAFNFNGSGNYIEVSSSQSLEPTDEITISCWIKSEPSTSAILDLTSRLIRKVNPYSSGYLLSWSLSGDQRISWEVYGNPYLNNVLVDTLNTLLSNSWHQVSCTFSSSSGVSQLYIDGVLIEERASSINLAHTGNLYFGGFEDNESFSGTMDDILIYNRALSPSEIQQLYTAQSYAWSTNATTPTITVSPTQNTTYTCTVTQGNSTCTASVDITVNPAITNVVSATIIDGQSYTLGTQTLTTAGTYTEVFTSAAGCDSTVTLTLNVTAACLPAYVPIDGLLGYWPFCGNANDESGNGNDGIVSGADLTADRNGNLNSAYNFNGSSDFITSGLDTIPGNAYTISAWYNSKVPQSNEIGLVVSRTTWNVSTGLYLFNNNAYLQSTSTCDNFHYNGYTVNALNDSIWHHYVALYDGAQFKIYVDGELMSTTNSSIQMCIDANFKFGVDDLVPNRFFAGDIDEVAIYSRALNQEEITSLFSSQGVSQVLGCTDVNAYNYNPSANADDGSCISTLTCNITTPTTTLCADQSATLTMNTTGGAGTSSQLPANLQQGLVAYYPFNGNANDESGNGNNGVVNGATLTSDRFGNLSSAYNFNSNNNSIVVNHSTSLSIDSEITLSAWIDPIEILESNSATILSKGIQGNYWNYGLNLGGGIASTYPNYLYTNYSIGSFSEVPLGQWSHLVVSISEVENTFLLFLNGMQISEVSNLNGNYLMTDYSQIINDCCNAPLTIGRNTPDSGAPFYGSIDDILIYNRALSPSEIQQLYTAQSYAWSTNATTPTITVSPTTNTTYSCTVTSGTQTCTASVDITVTPAITNAVSATIIDGQSYTLGTQTLTTAGTYTEVFTSAEGCDSTVTLTLSVEPLLTCEITSNSTSVCSGEDLILSMNSNASDIVNVGQSTFNGQGYIQFPNAGLTGSSSRTISYRAKTSSQNIMSVLNYGGAPNNGTGLVELGMNLNMWFGAGSGYCDSITKGVSFFSNSHSVNIGKTIFDNEWHTVTYVMGENNNSSFSSIKVYVDGILVSQGQNNTPYCGHNWGGWTYNTVDGPLTIGKPSAFNPYASKFVGSIADVGMWSRALTSVEVANLNGQTPAAIPLGLAHHYSLLGNAPVDLITGASGQVLGLTGSNIAWSTNATTPTITVSPTTNTTYSCTVTSGTQTCTSSIDITVNPQQTYFADADGDGYGNPDVVVQDCNTPVGYVSDNTDCNDNNAAVFAASTETCNGLDDDCDGQVDEGLTIAAVNATSVTTALYPTCSGNALKSANLNNGTNSDLIEGNGLDLWYSLTAQYNTLRASLSAAFGDNEIRLYSYNNGCFELLETEHEVYTTTSVATGNQILISDDLIPGQTYYIAVHNISGTMNPSAKMCFNHFVGTTCDHYYSNNTGIYNNVCTSFKAQYKGNATNYIFDVLSATQNNANLNITPWSYTTTTANSVVPRLGTIFPVNMSASAKVYTLRIPVIYAIPDAAGNYTSITANATTTCTVTLNAELPVALRAVDRCPNTKNTTSSISIDRTICGALRYEWEFTQQIPSVQSPVTLLGGLNTTVFFLNNVPGMGTGKTYNVRVRPIHTNGEVGSWGTAQCLKTGTAGMVMQSENAEAWANHDSPEQEERFTLYPNPTSTGRFTLTTSNTSDDEVKDIQMKDITGKLVYKTQVVLNGNAVEIEFGNLASGVYVVMVGEERMRLVIQ